MITFCFYVNFADLDNAVNVALSKFPCFVKVDKVDEEFYSVEVKCRIEDIASVERALSAYV